MLRAETDVFAEDVDAFKQSLPPHRRQDRLADQRNIAVGVALIFRRRGVGREQRRRKLDAIVVGQLAGDPQHFALVLQIETVAGFDLQSGYPFTQQAGQPRLGQRQQLGFAAVAGGAHGGINPPAAGADGLIGDAVQTLLPLLGPAAAEDEMGVAVD